MASGVIITYAFKQLSKSVICRKTEQHETFPAPTRNADFAVYLPSHVCCRISCFHTEQLCQRTSTHSHCPLRFAQRSQLRAAFRRNVEREDRAAHLRRRS